MTQTTAVLLPHPSTSDDDHIHRTIAAFLAGYPNAGTRECYELGLRQWTEWCLSYSIDPLDADPTAIEVWLRSLEDAGRKPKTVSIKLTAVSVLYRWMTARRLVDRNPMDAVRRPKVPKLLDLPYLRRDQVILWLDAADSMGGYPFVLACLLVFNALRISEACALNLEDVAGEEWQPVIRFVGKGGKEAEQVLNPRTVRAIQVATGGRTEGPMVLNGWGNRLTPQNGRAAVSKIAKAAGIRRKVTPHALRRSVITAMLNDRVPLRDVQHHARHSESRTTLGYDQEAGTRDRSPVYALQSLFSTG